MHKVEGLERFDEVPLAGQSLENLNQIYFHDLQVAVPEAPRLLGRSDQRLSSYFFLIDAGEHLLEKLSERSALNLHHRATKYHESWSQSWKCV